MSKAQEQYAPVSAAPVKSFFVSMLTRDIKLEEAILDLLDNCVDGILRTRKVDSNKPYIGYRAEIEFDEQTFSISDNCGGIPWSLSQYAFRMGRDPQREPESAGVVGTYGIGMKRAIFKMGKGCAISTQSGSDQYRVDITPQWVDDEDDWDIPVHRRDESMEEDGTVIVVGDLHEGISTNFADDNGDFSRELARLISSHYAYIIEKGLEVKVNGQVVEPISRGLLFGTARNGSDDVIQPFLYNATTDRNVEVFVAVGFTGPIPSQDEIANEQVEKQRSTEDAGWTVICNDRAVLHCDRSELTGWGVSGVPRYHTQFIAISGIAEFRCDDPAELPTTTTKRGVDASSILYLQVKDKMREGMKLFTDYTNRWKGRTEESRPQFEAPSLSLLELKAKTSEVRMSATRRSIPGSVQYKPELPRPLDLEPRKRRISFTKEIDEVSKVASFLFDDPKALPSDVGEKCFDLLLEEVLH